MANWALYCVDSVYGRFAGTEVAASQNDAYAANVVDGNPSNVWQPSSTSAFTIGFYVGTTSVMPKGIALCNHSLSGEVITLYAVSSMLGGGGTLCGTWTVPDNEDVVLTIASPSVSSFYWEVRSTGATTSDYIGEVSLLDDDYYIELDYPSAPRFPIGLSANSGSAVLRSGAGVPYEHVVGGVGISMPLTISVADFSTDTPGKARTILNWYREGRIHRLWVTDDTFGSSATGVGRGYYCHLPQLPGQIAYPGSRGDLSLPLELIPYDRQGS